jgi:hypoxanthine phosphoribosyltransferase
MNSVGNGMDVSPNEAELSAILGKSRLVVGEAEILTAVRRLAADIDKHFKGRVPVVLCVMNGGLMLTAGLMSSVKIHACVDYLQTSRYRGGTQGGELEWRIKPSQPLQGRPVLLVDDIFDEGFTLAAIARFCLQQGASEVFSVVLLDKQHDRKVPGFRPDLVGLGIEDEYVVGFGMDYKGYFRHLPAIYSIDGALEEAGEESGLSGVV